METTSELRRRAADLAYQGKYREAVGLYERILERPGADGEIALRLGTLLRKLGEPGAARAAFERAIDLFGRVGRYAQASAAEQLVAELTRAIRSSLAAAE